MSHSTPHPSAVRHCDVAVVGARTPELGAALQLVRAGRAVIVIDTERARPGLAESTASGRAEVREHGGEILHDEVASVRREDDRFALELSASGARIIARRVLGDTELAEAGAQVGAAIAANLDADDVRRTATTSGHQDDWDARYSGEQLWSGNPNGSLVAELDGARPGRALDVGAGEGGDAIWLAEQGWTVTASDISQRALDRIDAVARRRGLRITKLLADANAGGFGSACFELVTAHYASIGRTPDGRAVAAMMDAVAPGGTLLVVGHDLPPSDADAHPRHFDPDAYVQVKDVAAAVRGAAGWHIEVDELRERPAGSATGHQHPHDVILRARRSSD